MAIRAEGSASRDERGAVAGEWPNRRDDALGRAHQLDQRLRVPRVADDDVRGGTVAAEPSQPGATLSL
jgi:hypothetical protein